MTITSNIFKCLSNSCQREYPNNRNPSCQRIISADNWKQLNEKEIENPTSKHASRTK